MIFILAFANIVEASILEPSGNSKYCAALTAPYPGPLPEEIGISNNYCLTSAPMEQFCVIA
jgi:hypothetical protein